LNLGPIVGFYVIGVVAFCTEVASAVGVGVGVDLGVDVSTGFYDLR
jgi:hypothetical protein